MKTKTTSFLKYWFIIPILFVSFILSAQEDCDSNTLGVIEQLSGPSSFSDANAIYASAGQSFRVPSGVTSVDGIKAYLRISKPNTEITLSFYEGPAVSPIGTPITSVSYITGSELTFAEEEIVFEFENSLALIPGNEYYYLISPSYSPVGAPFAYIVDMSGDYTDGSALSGLSSGSLAVWNSGFVYDLKFSVFVNLELPDADEDSVPDCLDQCPGFDDNIDNNDNGIPDGCEVIDTVPPIITLIGFSPQVINVGDPYIEQGATAYDEVDGDLTESIVIDISTVDVNTPGNYFVTYNVSDAAGNEAIIISRKIEVLARENCVITSVSLSSNSDCDNNDTSDPLDDTYNQLIFVGFEDAPTTGQLVVSGDLSSTVDLTSGNATSNLGFSMQVPADGLEKTIEITFSEAPYCTFTKTFIAKESCSVAGDEVAPIINLVGDASIELNLGVLYQEQGATAFDEVDGELTDSIVIDASAIDVNTEGVYFVTYNVSDAAGNAATEVTRKVVYVAELEFEPEPCIITEIAFSNSTECDNNGTPQSSDDFYYQLIFVSFENAPTTGQMLVSGDITQAVNLFDGFANSNIGFSLEVPADGLEKTISVSFSEAPDCAFTTSFMAKESCSEGDVNTPPVVVGESLATVNIDENQTFVYDVDATDLEDDLAGLDLTYSISTIDGVDGALFDIEANTGIVTFTVAPDFENPLDYGANNGYNIRVLITDSEGAQTLKNLSIIVTDVDEIPICTVAIESTTVNGEVYIYACEGNTDSFLLETSVAGNGTLSYQWQDIPSDFSTSWQNIEGATNTSLTVAQSDLLLGSNYFRVVVTSDNLTPDNLSDDCTKVSGLAATIYITSLPTVTFTALADLNEDAGVQPGLGGGLPTGGIYSGSGVIDDGNGMTYSFDPALAGVDTHTLTYTFADERGCSSSASDDVEVLMVAIDTTAPIITLLGDNTIELNVGDTYEEFGATATDNADGDITDSISIDASLVDTSFAGSYTVTYNVSDTAGNAATEVTRVVTVNAPNNCGGGTVGVIENLEYNNTGLSPANSIYLGTGQSFIATEDATEIDGIEVNVSYTADIETEITINLYEGAGSGAIGTSIATATHIWQGAAESLSIEGTGINFEFENTVNLNSGSSYYFIISPVVEVEGTLRSNFPANNSDPYADGNLLFLFSGGSVDTLPFTQVWDLRFSFYNNTELIDSDGDGICDELDQCPGFDDTVDSNENGIPDGCDEVEVTTTTNNPNENINLALLDDATLSGSVTDGRGTPMAILYDPLIGDYRVTTDWNEYGVRYGTNLGRPSIDDGFFWQVDWAAPKAINYVTIGGAYDNQPQPNSMWRVSYLNNEEWITLEEGQGGWIDGNIYKWDGTSAAPITADAMRVQIYSDGENDLENIHLRGRGGRSNYINDSDTATKATLIQYLPSINGPIADFVAVTNELNVDFDASLSSDDGNIVNYQWDFGDGSTFGSGLMVAHTYPQSGIYSVTLRTTDNDGLVSVITKPVTVTDGSAVNDPDANSNLALLDDASVTGSVAGRRGAPQAILYNPAIEDYFIRTNWNEYGEGFGFNLGRPEAGDGLNWQVDWLTPKAINYITFGGTYDNQPQPNAMWRISYHNNGEWITLDEGQGGWIDRGIYELDRTSQAPITAMALRVQIFSDGITDLVSIHLRGRGGVSNYTNDSGTEIKATLIQYLPETSEVLLRNTQPIDVMRLSPNPTSGEVLITFDIEQEIEVIEISDLTGRIVKRIKGGKIGTDGKQIFVSGLPNGIYNLRAISTKGILHQEKLIVKTN